MSPGEDIDIPGDTAAGAPLPPPAPGAAGWRASVDLRAVALAVTISTLVTGLSLGLYERYIRAPRTPRIGVVDLTKLMQLGRKRFEAAIVATNSTDDQRKQALEASTEFAEKLRATLAETGAECRCTLVGLPAVFGEQGGAEDHTDAVRRKLGL